MSLRFEYVAPETLEDARALLVDHGEEAKIIAGGQSLLIMLREGALRPRFVVGLERVPGLAGVAPGDDGLTIGALATHRSVYRNDLVRRHVGILARACESVGPLAIHSAGTLGGNVCHNAPGADPPVALLALDARAVIAGSAGERRMRLADFLRGPFETALGVDEILMGIDVPALAADARWGYLKFSPRVMDMAIASVAVVLRLDGDGVCREARVAIGGVAPSPYRARETEVCLVGRRLTPGVLAEAGGMAGESIDMLSDFHASATYRRRVLPVLVRRAVALALTGERDARRLADSRVVGERESA